MIEHGGYQTAVSLIDTIPPWRGTTVTGRCRSGADPRKGFCVVSRRQYCVSRSGGASRTPVPLHARYGNGTDGPRLRSSCRSIRTRRDNLTFDFGCLVLSIFIANYRSLSNGQSPRYVSQWYIDVDAGDERYGTRVPRTCTWCLTERKSVTSTLLSRKILNYRSNGFKETILLVNMWEGFYWD